MPDSVLSTLWPFGEPSAEGSVLRRPRVSDRSFLAELFRATMLHQHNAFEQVPSVYPPFGFPRAAFGDGQPAADPGNLAAGSLPGPSSQAQDQPPRYWLSDPHPSPPPSLPAGFPTPTLPLPSLPGIVPPINPSGIVSSILHLLPGQPSSGPIMQLTDYPRPPGDTGRGFDWIPTLHSDRATVDRFVRDVKKMGASWITFLNDGAQIGGNDYLVKKLVENHIEPVMRIYTSHGSPISGDLTAMVRHYAALGVHYFLPYNEPNLPEENPNGQVSVSSYVDRWIPAAKAILAGGGLPGIGALAPGAPVDDVQFLHASLDEIKKRGASDLLNQAWVSVHNYTFNRPVDYQGDSNGFLKFRWYDQVVHQELGRDLPIISTEGGPRIGDDVDPRYPPVDEARRDQLATDAFAYLAHREPYFFAQTQWVLANEAGGGHDPRWEADALYGANGSPTPLAQTLIAQEATA